MGTYRRGRGRATPPALALALACLVATPAGAAPVPIAGTTFIIEVGQPKGREAPIHQNTLPARLQGNCMSILADQPWVADYDGIRGTWSSASHAVTGSWDVDGRKGSVTPVRRGGGVVFDAGQRKPGDGRSSMRLADIGLELAGSRAYLTGRLQRTRARHAAAGKVQRVGLIRKPTLGMGQLHKRGEPKATRDIPNTFAVTLQGKVTLLAPLARVLQRESCKGRDMVSQDHGPIRAGMAIGTLTAQLQAAAATGLAGTVPVAALFQRADDDAVVGVTGLAGEPLDADGALALATVAGNRTPLRCALLARFPTQACYPGGGAAALAGGFVLTLGDRRCTISGLVIAYTLAPGAEDFEPAAQTLTGTIDGAPFTLGTSADGGRMESTPEARAAIGAALGAEINGGVFPGVPEFAIVAAP